MTMTRSRQRRGTTFRFSLLFTITMAVGIILQMTTQAQPQHFFKANAPVSKSLPRIGRRSDLETFPLPLSEVQVDNNWQGEGGEEPQSQNIPRNQQQERGESSFIIPILEDDHLAPSVLQLQEDAFLWRKLMGDGNLQIRNYPPNNKLHDSTRSMFRSRTWK